MQYQPDDATLFTVDALFADLWQVQDNSDIVSPAFGISGTGSNLAPLGAPPLKANTLGNGNINILDYAVDQRRNNLTYLAATNVGLTSERAGSQQDTRFSQLTSTPATNSRRRSRWMRVWAGPKIHFRIEIFLSLQDGL